MLERETVTTVDDDTGEVGTSTRTFEYENVPCAAPVSARPERVLFGELLGIRRPVSAALDCGRRPD